MNEQNIFRKKKGLTKESLKVIEAFETKYNAIDGHLRRFLAKGREVSFKLLVDKPKH